ncbi:MAG: tryptophan synthase subunit alpha, partial [Candidatus Omnitrophica bacterium]|nr:tryptophan synthase subunit alpha [Candidatus Omnitrophota bacterium]
IYYVSLTGVTGARKALANEVSSSIKSLRDVTSKPVCVGFGISKPSQAAALAKAADGVIVGSAIIDVLERNLGDREKMVREIERFAASLARAVHGVKNAGDGS